MKPVVVILILISIVILAILFKKKNTLFGTEKWTLKEMKEIKELLLIGMKKENMKCVLQNKDNTSELIDKITEKLSNTFSFQYMKNGIINPKSNQTISVQDIIMEFLPKYCEGYPGSWTNNQMKIQKEKMNNSHCSKDPVVTEKFESCVVDLYSKSIPFDQVDSNSPNVKEAIEEILSVCAKENPC